MKLSIEEIPQMSIDVSFPPQRDNKQN